MIPLFSTFSQDEPLTMLSVQRIDLLEELHTLDYTTTGAPGTVLHPPPPPPPPYSPLMWPVNNSGSQRVKHFQMDFFFFIDFNRLKILISPPRTIGELSHIGGQTNQSLWEGGDLMRFTDRYTAFCRRLCTRVRGGGGLNPLCL